MAYKGTVIVNTQLGVAVSQAATFGLPLTAIIFTMWAAYFAIPFFWLLVHPFADFWRRRSGRAYAAFAIVLWLSFEAVFWMTKAFWFHQTFTRSWQLWLLGAALIAVEPLMVSRVEGQLSSPILVGWAERDPRQFPPRVVDTGIYARLRHPRYVAAISALLGLAVFSGSLRLVELSALSIPVYWLLTEEEERELLARVGGPFREYRARVPRFLPRFTKKI
jgi:protein-S-isoprenylcysteine O-methyltransferase Ste14